MLLAFQVTIPANGSAIALEIENADSPTGTSSGEVFSEEGGEVYLRNTGTVNCLVGGNDQNCVMPLNTTDPMTPRVPLGPNDAMYAKIATGSSAGQITVMKRVI